MSERLREFLLLPNKGVDHGVRGRFIGRKCPDRYLWLLTLRARLTRPPVMFPLFMEAAEVTRGEAISSEVLKGGKLIITLDADNDLRSLL